MFALIVCWIGLLDVALATLEVWATRKVLEARLRRQEE